MASPTQTPTPAQAAQSRLPGSNLSRAVMLGAVTIILCYGLGEFVEQTLLRGGSTATIHLEHMVRGIVSSVVTASVVGWSLVRTSPPLLAPAPEAPVAERSHTQDARKVAHYTRWLIQMRWLVVVVATALVVIAVHVMHLLPAASWAPLITTLTLLAATNVLYTVLAGVHERRYLEIQIVSDLLLLTLLLHFSGGIENPLWMIAMFHVVIAGVLLPPRRCYAVAAVASALLSAMAWAEYTHLVHHFGLALYPHGVGGGVHASFDLLYVGSWNALQAVMLGLIGYFITTLAERARNNEVRLEAMAERALGERQLLEQALATTGTGLRVCNAELEPEWLNSRWREWFQPGCCLDDTIKPVPARETLVDGQTRVSEVRLVAPVKEGITGGERVYQLTTAPVLDADGGIVQVAELAQDVTQQKQAQQQLLVAGKLAAVGRLAGQVAHEVNNPIAIISGKARLLLSGHQNEMSPKVATELEKIVSLSERVANIARGLLSYGRPSPGARSPVDVCTLVRNALAMVDQRAQAAGVQLEDRLGSSPKHVNGNAGELEQVFLNLLLNALDAIEDGGTISATTQPCKLEDGTPAVGIVVADDGAGVAPDVIERIWEPFFSTKGDDHGTGLGLAICQGLVQGCGGTIVAESPAGGGARFTVRLPRIGSTGVES